MTANAPPRWRAILQLCRFSNTPTVWSNVLAGWCLAGGGWSWRLIPLLLGGTALYFAGTTLNDYCDAKFDRQYRPERPIPSGALNRHQVSWLGLGWLTLGLFLCLAAGADRILLSVLIALVLTYDIIHKQTRWAGLLMGGARAALILAAGSAAGAQDTLFIALAGIAFVYIAGLTWLAAGESGPEKRAYPRAQTALLLMPILLAAYVVFRAPSVFAALLPVMLVIWLWPALPINRPPLRLAIPRLLAAIILIDALAMTYASPWLGGAVALTLFPLALYWQKSFAAT